MYISQVTFYTVDYGEEDLYVPSIRYVDTALIPTQTVEIIENNIFCGRDEVFRHFKCPQTWEAIRDRNYIKVLITSYFNDTVESTSVWYGWVDSVDCISDTVDAFTTSVTWHVDYWRTFIKSASMGAGCITRRKYNASDLPGIKRPVQDVPHAFETIDSQNVFAFADFKKSMLNDSAVTVNCVMHCIMAFIEGSGEQAKLRYAIWPVAVVTWTADTQIAVRFSDVNIRTGESGGQYYFPNLSDTFQGDFGSLFGIDPEQVKGVWLSYVSPFDYTMSNWVPPISEPTFSYNGIYTTYLGHRAVVVSVEDMKKQAFVKTIVTTGTSTELKSWVILDETGTKAGLFPPGMTFLNIECSLAVSAAGCYQVFRPTTLVNSPGQYSSSAGCEVRIPCIQVPVTANSWASYVYSGQRDYEISSKRQQIQTAFMKGLAGSVSSGAEGAMAGAIAGKENAGPLAALGLASGVISATASAAIDTANFDTVQRISDRQKAAQADTLLFYGGNLSPFNREYGCFGPCLALMVIDSYSSSKWMAYVSQYGIECDEVNTNVRSYLNTYTGAVQVKNLQIGGIPVKAARYIKKRLADGVIFK